MQSVVSINDVDFGYTPNDVNYRYIRALSNQNPICIINCQQISPLLSTAIITVGVMFWAHGQATHDAWFNGETVAGQALTGLAIATVCLLCCCFCGAGCVVAASAHDSEADAPVNEVVRANRLLTQNSLFKKNADIENNLGENKQDDNTNGFGI